jgi:hypothetical protein
VAAVSTEEPSARRGDLVVVHTTHLHYIVGEGNRSHDEFAVGVVTNITRGGLVKAYRPVGYDTPVLIERLGRQLQQVYLMARSRIDVDAALDTARRHTWPGYDQPRYYDTLGEVKDALRPHLHSTLGVKP